MSDDRDIDVLAVGGISIDFVLKIPRLPAFDTKELAMLAGRLPGGPVANLACAASRLGLCVSSFALVGDDQSGRLIIEDFERYSVDNSLVQIVENQETPFTVILIDPTGEKAIVVVPTIEPVYPLPLAAEALTRTRVMAMMPQPEEQFLALARLAHERGAEVMIDIEPTVCAQRNRLRRILMHTDIASFNQFGFRAAAGTEPSREAARDLLQFGPHTIIVTRGGKGSLAVTRDESAAHGGFKVPVVDTTGAGDTFHAAYLVAMLRGESLKNRLRFANAAAAISVTRIGPRGWLPALHEVTAFLKERGADEIA